MPRLRLLASFAFALAVAVLAAAPGAHAQGVLTFDAVEHDFGSIPEGDKPTHVFAFTNTGDRPVQLKAVQPSCGCTAPAYSTQAVAPGGRGEITVEYDSNGRPGSFNKTINVQADGARPEWVTLRILGDVIPNTLTNGVRQGNLTIDADLVQYSILPRDTTLTHTFRLQNTGSRPIRIREVRTYDPAVAVTGAPERPVFAGDIVELTTTFRSTEIALGTGGAFNLGLTLMTDDEQQPTKSLSLRGWVQTRDPHDPPSAPAPPRPSSRASM